MLVPAICSEKNFPSRYRLITNFGRTSANQRLASNMILATSNKLKNLLQIRYIDTVKAGDISNNRSELAALHAELGPGFRLLADFSALDKMDTDCAAELGEVMEQLDQAGVSAIVRVIPDPQKDIGMNILSLFHYKNRPRTATCSSISEAVGELSL